MSQPDTAAATARTKLDAALRSLRLQVPEAVAADIERHVNAAVETARQAPPTDEPPQPVGPPTAQAVIGLGDAIEEHRISFSTALGVWSQLPDDPDTVAAMLDRFDISPTAIREALVHANDAVRPLREIDPNG